MAVDRTALDHCGLDWEAGVRTMPKAMAVVRLADTHGFVACCERWSYLSPSKIRSLIRAGRKQLERRQSSAPNDAFRAI